MVVQEHEGEARRRTGRERGHLPTASLVQPHHRKPDRNDDSRRVVRQESQADEDPRREIPAPFEQDVPAEQERAGQDVSEERAGEREQVRAVERHHDHHDRPDHRVRPAHGEKRQQHHQREGHRPADEAAHKQQRVQLRERGAPPVEVGSPDRLPDMDRKPFAGPRIVHAAESGSVERRVDRDHDERGQGGLLRVVVLADLRFVAAAGRVRVDLEGAFLDERQRG
jgi:hypothetical protein